MQFMVLIYTDAAELDALPEGKFDEMMRGCLSQCDELRVEGRLLDSRMLKDPKTAKSVRLRQGRKTVHDGPFAETKEVLGGFNLIEARDMDEALEIASHFPWTRTGCVEVRPVQDIDAVRERVGAAPAAIGEAHIK
ncbi:MAG TPA: YciI family protein [Gemmatimonadaceae bacterium]|nr:YciI family protein [Gemmatimonadaceae bacterium]